MLMSIKRLKPFIPMSPPLKMDGAGSRNSLSLLAPPHRQAVESLLAHGGMVSVLLFEIQDFYVYSKIYGRRNRRFLKSRG